VCRNLLDFDIRLRLILRSGRAGKHRRKTQDQQTYEADLASLNRGYVDHFFLRAARQKVERRT
jgi:hypothetical protein